MRFASCLSSVRLPLTIAALAVFSVATLVRPQTLQAQVHPGEYALHQSGVAEPVGWVFVSADRSTEWWAYVDETYHWADSTSVGAAAWNLQAEYVGVGNWQTYTAWKADVLQRAAAQGRKICFQDHSVEQEFVDN